MKRVTKKPSSKKSSKAALVAKKPAARGTKELTAPTWRLGLGKKSPAKNLLGLHHGHPHSHHPDIKAKMLSIESTAPAAEDRPLFFRLGAHSVEHARVTLDYTEVVVLDDVSAPSAPRPLGRWVSVMVEMLGNPGSSATIEILNAMPPRLECTIPPGVTHWAESRVVVATWGD